MKPRLEATAAAGREYNTRKIWGNEGGTGPPQITGIRGLVIDDTGGTKNIVRTVASRISARVVDLTAQ